MTKIPSDDILERLYKLRIRESEKLKTVMELYIMEIHRKKAGPHYHRLKTMVKKVSSRIYELRILKPETEIMRLNAVVKNQGTKQRVQRILGDCWQWETNGQCSKGDNCSFRHDINKRAKTTQPNSSPSGRMREVHREPEVPEAKVPVEECFHGPARISSKEFAPTHFVKNGILQNACSTRPRVVADMGKGARMCEHYTSDTAKHT